MKGLLRKTYLEVRWPVLLFGIGLALIMALLTILLPKVLEDAGRILDRLAFVRPLLKGLLGTDPGEGFSERLMQAFLWVHPTVLSLVWAHALMYGTRVPAGEIDRGSIDFLLGLPVSRWKLYLAETVGLLWSGMVILAFGFSGHWLASTWLQPQMQLGWRMTGIVAFNLFAVYLAVGAMTLFVSAFSDRRGRAVGGMFAVLLLSFLLNFLAQFWPPAESVAFLSVMQYYRPALAIQNDAFPVGDVTVLLVVAGVFWVAGGIILRRRSICTV